MGNYKCTLNCERYGILYEVNLKEQLKVVIVKHTTQQKFEANLKYNFHFINMCGYHAQDF